MYPTALFNCVVGIDVHLDSLVCCVVWDEDGELHKETAVFGTFKNQKKEMAAWCKAHNPDLVLMESTGIYWKSPYAFLEKVGIRAAVLNARQVKQMAGKKTDMSDAEWLAYVGRVGCFCSSFVPAEVYRELRNPERYLLKVTDSLAAEKNRFLKILSDAGYRLSVVFSDVYGVNATKCIDGILEGKTPEKIYEELDLGRLKKAKPADIRAALEGDLSESDTFTLLEIKTSIEELKQRISRVESYIVEKVKQIHPGALKLLQTIPGISEKAAVRLIIELGGDKLDAFKTADHLASWIGVCPGNNESAGKRKSGRIRKGNYYLRRILCECANAAVRAKGTTLQSKYQSLRVRKDGKRSIIAIVHKIVRYIFYIFKNKVGYRDPQINYAEESARRNARRWVATLCTLPEWHVEAVDLSSGEVFNSVSQS